MPDMTADITAWSGCMLSGRHGAGVNANQLLLRHILAGTCWFLERPLRKQQDARNLL
jgi:hypothetical protein